MERGRIQALPKFFGYPVLSQERVKLQTSNLAGTFTGPIRMKAHYKFWRKWAWAYSGTAQIFWVPPIISGTSKATDFKFGGYIYRANPNKSPLKILEKGERGPNQGVPKFFRAPMYKAPCAVIFAIAQLSCYSNFGIRFYGPQCTMYVIQIVQVHTGLWNVKAESRNWFSDLAQKEPA